MSFALSRRLAGAGFATLTLTLATPDLDAQARPATQRPTAAAPKATLTTTVEGISEYALPNGMKVLLFPDQSKPTVTVNITYLVGSRHEGYGEAGMAHLLEHMLFKGTPKYRDVMKELTSRGARRNGSTWYDRTNYFETLPATDQKTADANLEFALDLEAERMMNSFVAKKDLETEFSVVRNEFENRENSPTNVLFERIMSAAYQWHGYGRSPIGNKADIEEVPIERLQAFYKKYYQPDNAILVVAGKFEPAKALALIENKFGRIPRPKRSLDNGNILFATYTKEPVQDGERFVTVRRVGDSQVLLSGYHVPAGAHPDYAAVRVLSHVLGNSPSGRLYKALVDPKLVAGIETVADETMLRESSMIMFGAMLRADQNIDTARSVMDRTIDAVRTTAVTAEEVQRAKDALLRSITLQLNNSETIGYELSEWMARGDWRLLFLHRDRLEKVTPADVQRVAGAYLKQSNRTYGYFVPTTQPDRAEIPSVGSIAAMVGDYKGRAVVQAGEVFEASHKNIDARTRHATLTNGMHVTLLPKQTRGQNVVARMQLRFGTEQALMNKGQIPAITGTMLSRGTTKLTRQQVADSLAKLNAQVIMGATGPNGAQVSITTTRPSLIPAMELVAEQLRSPRFDTEELEKHKKERLAGIEAAKSQPDFQISVALNQKLNPRPKGHPQYSPTADEQIAEISAVTQQDVQDFHRTFYTTQNADLTVVGDFDAAEVQGAATRLFGDWKNNQPYVRLARPYVRTDSAFVSIETPDKQNAFFIAAQNLNMRDDHPDYPALLFGNFLLGSGSSSRLWDRLRQKEGITYGVGSGLQITAQDSGATWLTQGILNPANAERFAKAWREEIDRAIKDGFTAAEINAVRAGYLQGRSQARANDAELVNTLLANRFNGRTMTFDEQLEAKIAALTPEQINAAIRKHIDPKQIIIMRAGDFAKNPAPRTTP
ncbi:MAG TPA: pitrilysin family protein [Gemmatimonadaceae bacterium]|nr:pitrilysin family protein [Gemmatimonadaceae bacterium]